MILTTGGWTIELFHKKTCDINGRNVLYHFHKKKKTITYLLFRFYDRRSRYLTHLYNSNNTENAYFAIKIDVNLQ